MRAVYVPITEKQWLAHLQSGHGLDMFRGGRLQRGYGLGGIFGSLLRSIMPIAKSVGRVVGRQALKTGAAVASDVLHGGDVGQALRNRGRAAIRKLKQKGLHALKQHGAGAKQKGGGIGTRSRGPAKGIKALRKPKKRITRKRKRDALGVYQ